MPYFGVLDERGLERSLGIPGTWVVTRTDYADDLRCALSQAVHERKIV